MKYAVETYRIRLEVKEEFPSLSCPEKSIELAQKIYQDLDVDREHFSILCLDVKNKMFAYKVLFSGSISAVYTYPREIFRAALLLGASSIILVHNHPSGDPVPSVEDKYLYQETKELGNKIGVVVLDEIILGDVTSFSFARGH